jgi:hypothetical protein
MRLGQLDAHAIRHQHVEHAPEQAGTPQTRNRIEHDDHGQGESTTPQRQVAFLPSPMLQENVKYIAKI